MVRAGVARMIFSAAAVALVMHVALLSLISFGGVPGVLPDLHDFVVTRNGWLSDRDFANCFAVVQAIPGPNMVLMASFIGWQVGGLPAAAASAVAMFAPACTLSYAVFGYWDRFRHTYWQRLVRRGLAPVTIGLVIAGGFVMARTGDVGWTGAAVSIVAIAVMLGTRINPLWLLGGGAILGGCGWL
jgi:chromate transporter